MSCFCGCFDGFGGTVDLSTAPQISKLIHTQDVTGAEPILKQLAAHKGVKKSNLCEALRLAISTGDVDAQLKDGATCLHEAAACNQVAVIRELLKSGATPSLVDNSGTTALARAVKAKAEDAKKFLQKTGSEMSTQAFTEILAFVEQIDVFKTLPKSEYPALAAAFRTRTYDALENIIKQGDPGNSFYVIIKGSAKVLVAPTVGEDPVQVNVLKSGDYFGEAALLSDEPRNATIQAIDSCQVRELIRTDFEALNLRNRLRFKKRKAVCQIDDGPRDGTATKKSQKDIDLIVTAMLKNEYMGSLVQSFPRSELQQIAEAASHKMVVGGHEVIIQDEMDPFMDFYVIEDGKFDVFKDGKKVKNYGPGESFGELALLYRAPRAATVTAATNAKLWAVSRQSLRNVTQAPLKQKLESYAKMLKTFDFLKDVDSEKIRMLADALLQRTFKKGEFIMKQNEAGSTFFILTEGTVSVLKDGSKVKSLTGGAGKVVYFGETAIVNNTTRDASIQCETDKVTTLVLDASDYLQVVNPESVRTHKSHDVIEYSRDKCKKLGLLGCGGFGVVTLVKYEPTGMVFALKALSKGHIVLHKQESHVMNEKNIMRMTNSPFLVRLAATFNSQEHIFFLMEPAMGGELFTLYQKQEFYGSEEHARFYVACVTKAFEHIHARKVVYRDLKPENLLLDAKGYCKVTDFGLARFVIGHTYTTCGTPDYFAPEMVTAVGHTIAVDWWCLGILTYELMTGETPFQADDAMHIFKNVMKGIEAVRFESKDPWTDLVKSLCNKEPMERLAMQRGGVKNVQDHRWFRSGDFDWPQLEAQKMTAPYLPPQAKDASNFDACEEEAPPNVKYVDPGTKWDTGFEDRFGPKNFD